MREAYSDPPKLCGKLHVEVTSVLKPLHVEIQSELHVMPTFDEGSGDLASGLLACARVGPSDVPRHLLKAMIKIEAVSCPKSLRNSVEPT